MPLYEYQCLPQGHRFEVRHAMTETPEVSCPECSATQVRRIIHPVGIVFKGSGFYATDSRASNSSSKPAEKTEKTEKKDDAGKSESAKADSSSTSEKSEKKSDSGGGEAKASQSRETS